MEVADSSVPSPAIEQIPISEEGRQDASSGPKGPEELVAGNNSKGGGKPKRLCGAEKKRRRKAKIELSTQDGPTTSEAGAVALTTKLTQASGTPKRKPDAKDTPPSADRVLKKPKGPKGDNVAQDCPPREGGQLLTLAQRANPLTVVITDEAYPEANLTQDDFVSFREKFNGAVLNMAPENYPRFECSFPKGGTFILIASNVAARDWLVQVRASFVLQSMSNIVRRRSTL